MEKNKIYYYAIVIWCLSGLIYQTTMLFLEYSSGQTVVCIKIGRPQMETLPAITLCFENNFMYKKLAQIDPELRDLYDNYTNILEQFEKDVNDHPEETYKFIENINKTSLKEFSLEIFEKTNPRIIDSKEILVNFSTPLTG